MSGINSMGSSSTASDHEDVWPFQCSTSLIVKNTFLDFEFEEVNCFGGNLRRRAQSAPPSASLPIVPSFAAPLLVPLPALPLRSQTVPCDLRTAIRQAPELGSPELPTVGSAGHYLGRCKPCVFVHKQGCESGASCQFCHLCDPDEKRRRQKLKAESRLNQRRYRRRRVEDTCN